MTVIYVKIGSMIWNKRDKAMSMNRILSCLIHLSKKLTYLKKMLNSFNGTSRWWPSLLSEKTARASSSESPSSASSPAPSPDMNNRPNLTSASSTKSSLYISASSKMRPNRTKQLSLQSFSNKRCKSEYLQQVQKSRRTAHCTCWCFCACCK